MALVVSRSQQRYPIIARDSRYVTLDKVTQLMRERDGVDVVARDLGLCSVHDLTGLPSEVLGIVAAYLPTLDPGLPKVDSTYLAADMVLLKTAQAVGLFYLDHLHRDEVAQLTFCFKVAQINLDSLNKDDAPYKQRESLLALAETHRSRLASSVYWITEVGSHDILSLILPYCDRSDVIKTLDMNIYGLPIPETEELLFKEALKDGGPQSTDQKNILLRFASARGRTTDVARLLKEWEPPQDIRQLCLYLACNNGHTETVRCFSHYEDLSFKPIGEAAFKRGHMEVFKLALYGGKVTLSSATSMIRGAICHGKMGGLYTLLENYDPSHPEEITMRWQTAFVTGARFGEEHIVKKYILSMPKNTLLEARRRAEDTRKEWEASLAQAKGVVEMGNLNKRLSKMERTIALINVRLESLDRQKKKTH